MQITGYRNCQTLESVFRSGMRYGIDPATIAQWMTDEYEDEYDKSRHDANHVLSEVCLGHLLYRFTEYNHQVTHYVYNAVQDSVARTASFALRELGDTVGAVQTELVRRGITGRRQIACQCAIAHYMISLPFVHTVKVHLFELFVDSVSVDVPEPVISFIRRFDEGDADSRLYEPSPDGAIGA